MLKWALIFFVISVVAGLLGFTGISQAASGIARVLFFIAVAIFLVLVVRRGADRAGSFLGRVYLPGAAQPSVVT